MSKHVLLGTLILILVPISASAQGICPLNGTSSNKIVCVIPQTFGPFGLDSGAGAPLLANGHQAHFRGDFLSSFGPITEAMGIQVSQLPIASPSSGITFTYDPALKTFAPSTEETLGPILGERASTIGRNKLYATYGITRHLDFSVAVPILDVSLKVNTNATIVQNSFTTPSAQFPGGAFHQFDPTIVTSCGSAVPCLNGTFSNSGSATGIGDVDLRGKYEVYQGEHFGLAAGVDVRLPTGDEQNFLGSGAIGVRPFGVVSYDARVSPHAEISYEVNGKSTLAGDFVGRMATNAKSGLPDRFVYIVGVDASIVKRLTASFDIYGQRLLGAPQLFSRPYTDLGKCSDSNCTTLTPGTTHPDLGVRTSTDYNITNASVGLKYRPFSHLVVTGNALIKLGDSGLRCTVVPLAGVSYSF